MGDAQHTPDIVRDLRGGDDLHTRIEAAEIITDLLEALEHIVGCAHEAPRYGPFDQIDNDGQPYQSADLEKGLAKGRAAIAKAKGQPS